jgi:hypothetical protein
MTEKVVLVEERSATHTRLITAEISDGDLVIMGWDYGDKVRRFFHTSEYEYARRVRAKHLPRVLQALKPDASPRLDDLLTILQGAYQSGQFENDIDFANFLKRKRIPSEFWSHIDPD